jgi:hypothetical protein
MCIYAENHKLLYTVLVVTMCTAHIQLSFSGLIYFLLFLKCVYHEHQGVTVSKLF